MSLEHPWTEPPAPGEVIAVAPGISWLRMPLPFQLNHINLWLLEDGPGVTVVDTGVGRPDTRALWERIFAERLDGRPITRVLVTHFHPDHMGNAAWLTARWQADLWCTQAEWLWAQLVSRMRDPREFEPRAAWYRRHGMDEASLAPLRRRGNHYPGLVPEVAPEFVCIREGDTLPIGGRRWRVLTVLGHAPEHACLWDRAGGVLIAGDQVLPKITTNVSVWPEQPRMNPLRLYLDSFGRFEPMAPDTLVLPSHGLPFRGLHARLGDLRDHHEARLGEALDALVEPRTAAELVPVLFRRELDVHQLSFAMGEALAHLNFLEAEGRAARLVGADGVHRFRKA
ncbi:MAG: MBL fold metallo-hydrolase [Candidatus Rokubacteria bacterium]|nr:MBL fold metallo-hydrolase [Candidatus Rokubacteria bacterium]